MSEVQLSWERDVEPVVRKHASVVFRGHAEQEEMVSDAVTLAWEAFMAARKRIFPSRIAHYAVQQVKVGRQFKQSESSITGPNLPRCRKPRRDELFDVEEIATRPGDNPADIATLRVDFAAWILMLLERELQILIALLHGETTTDTASKFGLGLARVSQIRRDLRECYEVFTS